MFITHAQNFEDVMLWRALKQIEKGFYVDVGANHPVIDSVSKAFYDRGWRGVHVEPVPAYASLLRQARPDETVIEKAVGAKAGRLTLHIIPDTGLSSLIKEVAEKAIELRGYEKQEVIVDVLTLEELLTPYQGRDLHWLKIDVEGAEADVLRGWNSLRDRPWIMVVEATAPNTQIETHHEWESILLNAGYQFAWFDGLSRFYVASEHAELAQAFRTPPNVFDQLVPALLLDRSEEKALAEQRVAELSERVNELERRLASQHNERRARKTARRILYLIREKITSLPLINRRPSAETAPQPLEIPQLAEDAVRALEELQAPPVNPKLDEVISLDQMRQAPSSVSLVLPIVQMDRGALERSIQSVLRQTESTWELLLIASDVHAELARDWLDVDWRIRHIEAGVANLVTVAEFATSEFVVTLRQGDALDDDYVRIFVQHIASAGEVDLVYVDEWLEAKNGAIGQPFYKPDWSPEHLDSVNYIGRGFAIRKSILLSAPVITETSPDAADYALLLDITSHMRGVIHIDEILYLSFNHRARLGGFFSNESLPGARAALERKVHRENTRAEVRADLVNGVLDVIWPTPDEPVTLVILTGLSKRDVQGRGETVLVTHFVRSIIEKSTFQKYKILVVDDGETPEDLAVILAEHGHEIHSMKRNGAFSFAKKANFAVNLAPDGIVILLNDDMEVIAPDWIQRMACLAARPHIGAVGALLLYPEGKIQHAGMVMGFHGSVGQIFHGIEPNGTEYAGFASVQRNYSAVTGAAIAFRKSVFVSLGGFDEQFTTDYNDVDFCLRCIRAGYRVVQTPAARLYHFHNSSFKRSCDDAHERELFIKRWRTWIDRDPFFSKHFQKRHHDLPLIERHAAAQLVPEIKSPDQDSGNAVYRNLCARLHQDANDTLAKLGFGNEALIDNRKHDMNRQLACILRLGLFDKEFYLDIYPDVRCAGVEPILHYANCGDAEGRLPNPIFDPHFYRRQFAGEPLKDILSLYHYAVAGETAGLSASASFNPLRYRLSNPSLGSWLDHPLTHYLWIGRKEGLPTRSRIRLLPGQTITCKKSQLPPKVGGRRLKRAVNIIGPLDRVAGLGVSARGYLRAIEATNFGPVGARVQTREFGIQTTIGGEPQFPELIPDAAINIVHMNGDTIPQMMEHGGRELLASRYNVAVWFWELSTLRPEWSALIKYFHEFWAPTPFIARTIARSTKKPVHLVAPFLPYLKEISAVSQRESKPHFVYCFDANSILERKNPCALLDAFQIAFRPDGSTSEARLTFKITYPNRAIPEVERLYSARDADSRIHIIDWIMADEALHQLIASATAYVSPHRSEGLGLTVLEAMASLTPVIATSYGGVERFVTPDAAYPIDHRMVELTDDYPPYPKGFVWADPDVGSLASKLREVAGDEGRALAQAKRARARVIDEFASDALISIYRAELDRIGNTIFS